MTETLSATSLHHSAALHSTAAHAKRRTRAQRLVRALAHAQRLARVIPIVALLLLSAGCASDGVDGDDEAYMPDRVDGDTGVNGELNPNGCDLTGTWIAQLRTRNQALVGVELRTYNWFYYELESAGDDVIIHRGWDCGFQVCGATQLQLPDAQFDALAVYNRQDGELYHDASAPDASLVVEQRPATYKQLPNGQCEFSMGRWWWLRSAPLDRYPAREDFATSTLAELRETLPLPPKDTAATPGNDWDGDGIPGLRFRIDQPAGSRDTAQREWNEFGPSTLPDGLADFTVPVTFDNEELIYNASSQIFYQGATPIQNGSTVRFVKVSDQAPGDLPGFRAFCAQHIAERFRSEDAGDRYCAMRAQTATEVVP